MEESVDPFLQLDERSRGRELDDLASQAHADRILHGHLVPWIILNLLETERDLAGLQVVVEDHALDGIPTWSISSGFRTLRTHENSEIWARPSMPSSTSMKAP